MPTAKDETLARSTNDEPGAASPAGVDFEAVFGQLPSPYMIVDREFRYVAANQAYLRTLERDFDELVGRNLFEVFPNAGDGGRLLRASFERVLASGRPDSIAYIPYAIPAPSSRGGGMEMRYWTAVHTPLTDASGQVAFILQNTVDVTELRRLKEIAYGPGAAEQAPSPGETQLLQRAEELQKANASLWRETNQLRDLFMQAPGFMAVVSGPELTFTLVNSAYQQMVGHRELIGKAVVDALPEVRGQVFVDLLLRVMASREPFVGRAMSVRLQRTPGAPLEERFVDFVYQPIFGADGEAWGVFVEGSDVTDRVRAERRQRLLLDELNHRVKNTLATVQAIAAQTLRTNPDPTAFREAFEARLLALSATHDLLTASSWAGAALKDVLLVELAPHGPERYVLDGPDLALSPGEALTLGLVFHELATNAAKYGALSAARGCVQVRWREEARDGERTLELTWTEQGGPPVAAPSRRGFGSRLIERSVAGDLGGEAVLEFAETGVTCHVRTRLNGPADGG